MIWLHNISVFKLLTSTVFPLDAVNTSPGSIPLPSIMFSQEADMKWICSNSIKSSLHPVVVPMTMQELMCCSPEAALARCVTELLIVYV